MSEMREAACDFAPLEGPLAEEPADHKEAPPCVLVVFGASGDLTSRKILPALERLVRRHQLPDEFSVVGVARTEMSDDDFRKLALDAVGDAGDDWERLVAGFRYVSGPYTAPETIDALSRVLDELDDERGTAGNRLYYLATVPSLFPELAVALGTAGLHRAPSGGFARLVVEKPYGRDLASAEALDDAVHSVFDENQVYRIDHYLGKETVQNVLALRFANALFEPVWNRRYLDHVQISVAETLGVGHRGGFYETAGALRDIVQNHVLQVLGITAMEPAAMVDAGGIRDEKVKLLRAIKVFSPAEVADHVVRGQYDAGSVDDEAVQGYQDEVGVDRRSTTETYVALRLEIDNWRWAGVPFYIRTGKRLPKRVTEVALTFKPVPHLPFASQLARGLSPNAMIVRIQPDEGVTIRFGAKVPGQAFEVRDVLMDFSYGTSFREESPDAYERLLLDAMLGDATLFIRSDEVMQAWRVVQPVLEAWEDASPDSVVPGYVAGTWGPAAADRLLERDGRRWRTP